MEKRPFYRKVRQTLHETVSDSGKSILCYRGNNDKIYYVASSNDPNVEPGGGEKPSGGMIEVTWQELKDKRDAGKLTPGSLYRITDYQCTTTQANTRSAGHQFDIVLLALSENKLAEEGWAMMHDNIYDVTFNDGVTKKCYWYCADRYYDDGDDVWYEEYHLVDVNTKLGTSFEDVVLSTNHYIEINEDEKTINLSRVLSRYLATPNLTYNYFQNSNLSAWKVWYCLDNDKSRFAWAQEAKNEIIGIKIGTTPSLFRRDNSVDAVVSGTTYYGWKQDGAGYWTYTTTETPKVGDNTWAKSGPPGQFIPMQNPDVSYVDELKQPEGKGVIYRLIDEWGNDVPYDFKNLLIHNDTYNEYLYAIADITNLNEDPTLNGTKVNSIHVLSNNNNVLKPVAVGGFVNNPLTNIILLNNSSIIGEIDNCVVSNGKPI